MCLVLSELQQLQLGQVFFDNTKVVPTISTKPTPTIIFSLIVQKALLLIVLARSIFLSLSCINTIILLLPNSLLLTGWNTHFLLQFLNFEFSQYQT